MPKHTLISNLDALINTGELRIAAELLEASAAKDELKNLRRHVTNAGRATFSAPSGSHDDLSKTEEIAQLPSEVLGDRVYSRETNIAKLRKRITALANDAARDLDDAVARATAERNQVTT